MENIDVVGVWKVVGCVVLCQNSELSNVKGASLILRRDGSFSWFGPVSEGLFDLNSFRAYKVVKTPLKQTASVTENAVEHTSLCILFNSGHNSSHDHYICCEVTVKFGNCLVIQFPGLCLMHFRRVSEEVETNKDGEVNSIGSELHNLSLCKQDYHSVDNVSNECSGADSCNVGQSDDFSHLRRLNVADPCVETVAGGVNNFEGGFHCDIEQMPLGVSSLKEPFEHKDISLPGVDLLALSSVARAVKTKAIATSSRCCKSEYNGDLLTELDSDAHEVRLEASNNISCPSSSHQTQYISSTDDLGCDDNHSLLLETANDLEGVFSHSQFSIETSSSKKEEESVQSMSEAERASDDSSHLIECGLDESDSSSVDSSSSDTQLLSHICQDPSFSLLRALQEGYFSDLILTAENGVKFEVHSIILALSFPRIIWEDGDGDAHKKNQRESKSNENSSKIFTFPECISKSSINPSRDKCLRRKEVCSQNSLLKSAACTHPMGRIHSQSPGNESSMHSNVTVNQGKGVKTPSERKEDLPKVRLPRLPEAVLQALLHYAYSESLPENLAPETAQLCLQLLSPPCVVAPHTAVFRNLCSAYLRNTALRQDVISLTSEIHGCLTKMEEHLTMGDCQSMMSSEEEEEEDDIGRRVDSARIRASRDKNLPQLTPSRLCTALKQAAREAATAIVLSLELCQVYAKNHCHLGKREIKEMAQFAASRLAPLASQLDAVLSALLRSIPPASSPVLTGAAHSPPHQHNGHRIQRPHGEGTTLRDRLASHLVSEMESALEILSSLAISLKEDVEEILEASKENENSISEDHSSMYSDQENRSNLLQVYKDSRIDMLCYIYQRISFYLFHLLQKKESFGDLGIGGRFRVICQTLDQLSEELPIFLLRLRDALATIDEQLAPEHLSQPLDEWTTKISELLSLLSTHRSILQPLLLTMSELVQRETFLSSLRRLKLLNFTSAEDESRSHQSGPVESNSSESETTYGLSLVTSLVMPPNARRSRLSRRALKLLHTGKHTDMVFQVVLPTLPGCDSNNPPTIDYRNNLGIEDIGNLEWDEENKRWLWRVGAHRAIVAARCDWFRRALLSGMKEAINRKIMVHDTTPQLLQLFLQWIYSGQLQLDCNIFGKEKLSQEGKFNLGTHSNGSLGAEQLWALLVLADQLEVDDLKSACEHLLLFGGFHLSDPESTIACLSLADQVNARAVRNACLQHISCNPNGVVESELFDELPSSLQSEVYDRLIWSKPRKSQTTEWLLLTPEEDEDDAEDVKYGSRPLNTLHEIQNNAQEQQLNPNGTMTRDDSENEMINPEGIGSSET